MHRQDKATTEKKVNLRDRVVRQKKDISTRLIVLFILGCLFLNFPLLSLVSLQDTVFLGIPLLYAFVYLGWALFIALTALWSRHRPSESAPSSPSEQDNQ